VILLPLTKIYKIKLFLISLAINLSKLKIYQVMYLYLVYLYSFAIIQIVKGFILKYKLSQNNLFYYTKRIRTMNN